MDKRIRRLGIVVPATLLVGQPPDTAQRLLQLVGRHLEGCARGRLLHEVNLVVGEELIVLRRLPAQWAPVHRRIVPVLRPVLGWTFMPLELTFTLGTLAPQESV